MMPVYDEVRDAELGIYSGSCPNCGGVISDSRLRSSLPCTTCLPIFKKDISLSNLIKLLEELGTLNRLRERYLTELSVNEMVDIFEKCVGSKPWSIQMLWMRRLARNISFAMIAPTGIGKTTFGIAISIYYASKGYKTYIIVPTTMLAMQLERKFEEVARRPNVPLINYLVIHSKVPRKERELRERRLDEGAFDVLVTTSRYLLNNFERISRNNFKFIFVDDVDAVLRGSKAIDMILKLAGFDDDDIELALKLLRLRSELTFRRDDEKLVEEISKIEEHIKLRRARNNKVVVIASATGNPRGVRVKLFRELLGFEIGARPEFIRNVADLYIKPGGAPIEEIVINMVKKLGSGGLVYVPVDKGVEFAEALAKILNSRGIHAEALHSRNVKVINEFVERKLDVLIGVATYYGVLVRGLDLPEVVRYAIFVGVPRHKIPLRLNNIGPYDVLRLLTIVRDVIRDQDRKRDLDNLLMVIRRGLRRASITALSKAKEVLMNLRTAETSFEKNLLKAYEALRSYLNDSSIVNEIKKYGEATIIEENGELYILIPDVPTYIQASGRTSRLFIGGISKGLSIVVDDDERLLKGLESRARWLIDDFKFSSIDEVDLGRLVNEVDRDRELIKSIRCGLVDVSELSKLGKEFIAPKTILLVVESPNKARTIARFFGKPSIRDYGGLRVYEVSIGRYTLLVTASGGHIYDLITNTAATDNIYGVAYERMDGRFKFIPIYSSIKRCLKCGYQFTDELSMCPICGSAIVKNSINIVNLLRDLAYEVDEVYIGTDPDTEGEKIGYDIYLALSPYARIIRRIEFHEVTRKAILNSLSNPRDIELNLVKAQVVRRIEDRWLGFSLSSLLQVDFWKEYCRGRGRSDARCGEPVNRNLSAGRVQTPVLGWIVKHYEDYVSSKRKFLILNLNNIRLEIALTDEFASLSTEDIAEVVVKVLSRDVVSEELKPLPPYTTDSVLSDASLFLGLPAPQTMQVLQELFEMGFITYHRTDSTRVSEVGLAIAREYLSSLLGGEFGKYFAPRVWSSEGAHECIRPTRPADADMITRLISEGVIEPVRRLTRKHLNIYNLIFSRFIASQSKEAIVRKGKYELMIELRLTNGRTLKITESPLVAEGVVDVMFDGFSRFYKYFKLINDLMPGSYILTKDNFRVITKGVTPLLTQARLISMMRERGIGRPSTYSKIIETLFKRNYVIESRRRGYLIPTQLGIEVYYYLSNSFKSLVSEERTKDLEMKMDLIEAGKQDYSEILNELYNELITQGLVRVH